IPPFLVPPHREVATGTLGHVFAVCGRAGLRTRKKFAGRLPRFRAPLEPILASAVVFDQRGRGPSAFSSGAANAGATGYRANRGYVGSGEGIGKTGCRAFHSAAAREGAWAGGEDGAATDILMSPEISTPTDTAMSVRNAWSAAVITTKTRRAQRKRA